MIELQQATIRSGSFELADLSLLVKRGEGLQLQGASGSGKTTLLEAICGLRPIVTGKLFLEGQLATDWPPHQRAIGYVPQDLALFTTHTVQANLSYGLERQGFGRKQAVDRVVEIAELLQIDHLLDRRVRLLSGGEARRVAIGRAMAPRPKILLLDEPLAGLDQSLRQELLSMLESLRATTEMTLIHVSHDSLGSNVLADRSVHLVGGQLLEVDKQPKSQVSPALPDAPSTKRAERVQSSTS